VFRFIAGILFFTSVVLALDSILIVHKKRVYTVQLFSLKRALSKEAIMRTVPRSLQNKLHLHKIYAKHCVK